MQVDKKTEGGSIRYVLMTRIGEALMGPAPDDAVRAVLARTTQ